LSASTASSEDSSSTIKIFCCRALSTIDCALFMF
jgi:hypothetical protein